eukprot:CAMPEP_0185785430 /NCGR_PEP_ID=MMETSP1174-20130828/129563_1 /TAXON_ID=35687 /ORGANISM="Dictyocha speculum, Strain CCMP1381" /LENGTH=65 /DNA_ID=CAMNT_0028477503 /DNA_START=347 /DNA_END=541 /DNA_ORIENTATION=-
MTSLTLVEIFSRVLFVSMVASMMALITTFLNAGFVNGQTDEYSSATEVAGGTFLEMLRPVSAEEP